jgi:protein-L-isoaspartate(D-aspartate) O-methyltransferase
MQKEELIKKLKDYKFSDRIIKAFGKVEREKFIPEENKKYAYENIPLQIGYEATISQPYTIAFMLNLLKVKNKQKILEVGSGSGYVLALLSELSPHGKIFGIERIKELAEKSKEVLRDYKNVKVIHGNGFKGLEKEALFDRILVSASGEKIPENLINQLKYNGILVVPVRNSIFRIIKGRKENKTEEYPGFIFVPLIEE